MQEDILCLIELQKLDLEILRIEKAMAEVPEDLKRIQLERDKLQQKLNQLTSTIEEKESQRRLFEEELKEEVKRLKQTQARLTQIRGTREYQILLAEIEEIKRANKQKEEEILKLMEEIERQTEETTKIVERLTEVSRNYEAENEKFQELCQKLDQERALLLKKRGQIVAKISAKILKKYETLRQKKGGVGIVGVSNAVCEGCHMAIPPQLYIEIQKDNRYYECPHCKRLIYYKHYYEIEPEKESLSQERSVASQK